MSDQDERRAPLPEDVALRAIVEGVEAELGDRFFALLVQHLASALDVQYAFVSEIAPDRRSFRTRALWGRGRLRDNLTVPLAGTPCEAVLGGESAHHPENLQALFPRDAGLVEWNAVSYCGVPLLDRSGVVTGHLAIVDDRPMRDGPRGLSILRIFAARARAEIERVHAETALRASELHYRALYENAPLAYIAYDAERRIRHVNPAFVELSGFDEAEVQGLSYSTFSPGPDWEARFREVFDVAEQGRIGLFDVQARHRDGAPRWVRVTARAIRGVAGRLEGFFTLAADITTLKDAERKLRESETLYRELYEHAPLAYFTFGTDGTLQRWNERGPEITGYGDDELRGMRTADFHTDAPANREAFARLEREVFQEGRDLVAEVEGRRKDASTYWARVSLSPLRDETGRITGARSIAQDITELHLAQEAVRESAAQLSAIIQTALDAILVIEDDRRIVLINPAAERVFRCTAADVIGTSVMRLATPAAAESFARAMDDIRAGRKAFSLTEPGLRSRRLDGEEFEFEGAVSAARIGGRLRYTIYLRDLGERRRLEADQQRLELQTAYLQEEIKAVHNFEEIVGSSAVLQRVLAQVGLVAATDSSVLICGETGTGKELVARAIHAQSARRSRPLVKVNCAALPSGLVESELLGHEKGAFTGATERRTGRFELAHRGTIFLDEVGELPLDVQVKLLRVLQEREFERVGGSQTVKVDVRVIAATNRDLPGAVAAGTFRQDLYYRLNVFPVTLPPLRERTDDIPPLIHYFVARYAAKIGRKVTRVPQETMQRLVAYSWPGNVRELENVIERAVILSRGPELTVAPDVLPEPAPSPAPTGAEPARSARAPSAPAALRDVERQHIVTILKQTGWRIDGPQGAARLLSMNPSTLRSRMQKLGIRRSAAELS